MAKVLIIYHSQSGNTEAMAKAVARGTESVAGTEVTIPSSIRLEEKPGRPIAQLVGAIDHSEERT